MRTAHILLLALACKPANDGKNAMNIAPSHIETPLGVTLVQACTPSGPELCFNAIDDNCNGILDEGCGLATGLLQFTIAWGDSPADVDLRVTEPSGSVVDSRSTGSAEGLRLDRDCPKDSCHGQNVENVYFDGGEPGHGRYLVEVVLSEVSGASLPVSVRFGARVGSRSYGADLSLTQKGDRKAFAITL